MQPQKTKIIVISGPTASGKTGLGIALAKEYSGEIVSADSMQIYKGIPIASAQPTNEEMDGIPHHLMSFLGVGTPFSVADYCEAAHKVIADITSRGKTPIIVGGTGLYINSLVDDIAFSDIGSTEIRKELEEKLETFGGEYMYNMLLEIDKEAAGKIEPNNTRRVIRALEVYFASGTTFSKLNELSRKEPSRYDATWLNISFSNREVLYDRINQRVDIMVQNGLEAEARKYRNLCSENGAGQAIGHKELYPYFDGEIEFLEAIENLKTATRRYAKRQITWFSRRDDAISLPFSEDIVSTAKEIINKEI